MIISLNNFVVGTKWGLEFIKIADGSTVVVLTLFECFELIRFDSTIRKCCWNCSFESWWLWINWFSSSCSSFVSVYDHWSSNSYGCSFIDIGVFWKQLRLVRIRKSSFIHDSRMIYRGCFKSSSLGFLQIWRDYLKMHNVEVMLALIRSLYRILLEVFWRCSKMLSYCLNVSWNILISEIK